MKKHLNMLTHSNIAHKQAESDNKHYYRNQSQKAIVAHYEDEIINNRIQDGTYEKLGSKVKITDVEAKIGVDKTNELVEKLTNFASKTNIAPVHSELVDRDTITLLDTRSTIPKRNTRTTIQREDFVYRPIVNGKPINLSASLYEPIFGLSWNDTSHVSTNESFVHVPLDVAPTKKIQYTYNPSNAVESTRKLEKVKNNLDKITTLVSYDTETIGSSKDRNLIAVTEIGMATGNYKDATKGIKQNGAIIGLSPSQRQKVEEIVNRVEVGTVKNGKEIKKVDFNELTELEKVTLSRLQKYGGAKYKGNMIETWGEESSDTDFALIRKGIEKLSTIYAETHKTANKNNSLTPAQQIVSRLIKATNSKSSLIVGQNDTVADIPWIEAMLQDSEFFTSTTQKRNFLKSIGYDISNMSNDSIDSLIKNVKYMPSEDRHIDLLTLNRHLMHQNNFGAITSSINPNYNASYDLENLSQDYLGKVLGLPSEKHMAMQDASDALQIARAELLNGALTTVTTDKSTEIDLSNTIFVATKGSNARVNTLSATMDAIHGDIMMKDGSRVAKNGSFVYGGIDAIENHAIQREVPYRISYAGAVNLNDDFVTSYAKERNLDISKNMNVLVLDDLTTAINSGVRANGKSVMFFNSKDEMHNYIEGNLYPVLHIGEDNKLQIASGVPRYSKDMWERAGKISNANPFISSQEETFLQLLIDRANETKGQRKFDEYNPKIMEGFSSIAKEISNESKGSKSGGVTVNKIVSKFNYYANAYENYMHALNSSDDNLAKEITKKYGKDVFKIPDLFGFKRGDSNYIYSSTLRNVDNFAEMYAYQVPIYNSMKRELKKQGYANKELEEQLSYHMKGYSEYIALKNAEAKDKGPYSAYISHRNTKKLDDTISSPIQIEINGLKSIEQATSSIIKNDAEQRNVDVIKFNLNNPYSLLSEINKYSQNVSEKERIYKEQKILKEMSSILNKQIGTNISTQDDMSIMERIDEIYTQTKNVKNKITTSGKQVKRINNIGVSNSPIDVEERFNSLLGEDVYSTWIDFKKNKLMQEGKTEEEALRIVKENFRIEDAKDFPLDFPLAKERIPNQVREYLKENASGKIVTYKGNNSAEIKEQVTRLFLQNTVVNGKSLYNPTISVEENMKNASKIVWQWTDSFAVESDKDYIRKLYTDTQNSYIKMFSGMIGAFNDNENAQTIIHNNNLIFRIGNEITSPKEIPKIVFGNDGNYIQLGRQRLSNYQHSSVKGLVKSITSKTDDINLSRKKVTDGINFLPTLGYSFLHSNADVVTSSLSHATQDRKDPLHLVEVLFTNLYNDIRESATVSGDIVDSRNSFKVDMRELVLGASAILNETDIIPKNDGLFVNEDAYNVAKDLLGKVQNLSKYDFDNLGAAEKEAMMNVAIPIVTRAYAESPNLNEHGEQVFSILKHMNTTSKEADIKNGIGAYGPIAYSPGAQFHNNKRPPVHARTKTFSKEKLKGTKYSADAVITNKTLMEYFGDDYANGVIGTNVNISHIGLQGLIGEYYSNNEAKTQSQKAIKNRLTRLNLSEQQQLVNPELADLLYGDLNIQTIAYQEAMDMHQNINKNTTEDILKIVTTNYSYDTKTKEFKYGDTKLVNKNEKLFSKDGFGKSDNKYAKLDGMFGRGYFDRKTGEKVSEVKINKQLKKHFKNKTGVEIEQITEYLNSMYDDMFFVKGIYQNEMPKIAVGTVEKGMSEIVAGNFGEYDDELVIDIMNKLKGRRGAKAKDYREIIDRSKGKLINKEIFEEIVDFAYNKKEDKKDKNKILRRFTTERYKPFKILKQILGVDADVIANPNQIGHKDTMNITQRQIESIKEYYKQREKLSDSQVNNIMSKIYAKVFSPGSYSVINGNLVLNEELKAGVDYIDVRELEKIYKNLIEEDKQKHNDKPSFFEGKNGMAIQHTHIEVIDDSYLTSSNPNYNTKEINTYKKELEKHKNTIQRAKDNISKIEDQINKGKNVDIANLKSQIEQQKTIIAIEKKREKRTVSLLSDAISHFKEEDKGLKITERELQSLGLVASNDRSLQFIKEAGEEFGFNPNLVFDKIISNNEELTDAYKNKSVLAPLFKGIQKEFWEDRPTGIPEIDARNQVLVNNGSHIDKTTFNNLYKDYDTHIKTIAMNRANNIISNFDVNSISKEKLDQVVSAYQGTTAINFNMARETEDINKIDERLKQYTSSIKNGGHGFNLVKIEDLLTDTETENIGLLTKNTNHFLGQGTIIDLGEDLTKEINRNKTDLSMPDINRYVAVPFMPVKTTGNKVITNDVMQAVKDVKKTVSALEDYQYGRITNPERSESKYYAALFDNVSDLLAQVDSYSKTNKKGAFGDINVRLSNSIQSKSAGATYLSEDVLKQVKDKLTDDEIFSKEDKFNMIRFASTPEVLKNTKFMGTSLSKWYDKGYQINATFISKQAFEDMGIDVTDKKVLKALRTEGVSALADRYPTIMTGSISVEKIFLDDTLSGKESYSILSNELARNGDFDGDSIMRALIKDKNGRFSFQKGFDKELNQSLNYTMITNARENSHYANASVDSMVKDFERSLKIQKADVFGDTFLLDGKTYAQHLNTYLSTDEMKKHTDAFNKIQDAFISSDFNKDSAQKIDFTSNMNGLSEFIKDTDIQTSLSMNEQDINKTLARQYALHSTYSSTTAKVRNSGIGEVNLPLFRLRSATFNLYGNDTAGNDTKRMLNDIFHKVEQEVISSKKGDAVEFITKNRSLTEGINGVLYSSKNDRYDKLNTWLDTHMTKDFDELADKFIKEGRVGFNQDSIKQYIDNGLTADEQVAKRYMVKQVLFNGLNRMSETGDVSRINNAAKFGQSKQIYREFVDNNGDYNRKNYENYYESMAILKRENSIYYNFLTTATEGLGIEHTEGKSMKKMKDVFGDRAERKRLTISEMLPDIEINAKAERTSIKASKVLGSMLEKIKNMPKSNLAYVGAGMAAAYMITGFVGKNASEPNDIMAQQMHDYSESNLSDYSTENQMAQASMQNRGYVLNVSGKGTPRQVNGARYQMSNSFRQNIDGNINVKMNITDDNGKINDMYLNNLVEGMI